MKSLVVEDDTTSRLVMQAYLSAFGHCDGVAHGKDALEAFAKAHREGAPYELVCLDIMMPDMNGHDVLVRLRKYEHDLDIGGLNGAKVLMTTALGDAKNVVRAFKEQCEGYLVKPVTPEKLSEKLKELGFSTS